MSSKLMLEDPELWQSISYISQLNKPTTLTQLCQDLKCENERLHVFLDFMRQVGLPFEIKNSNEGLLFIPSEVKPTINLNLSLFEWLMFQGFFPHMSKAQGMPFHSEMSQVFSEWESKYVEHDLFTALDHLEQIVSKEEKVFLKSIRPLLNEMILLLEESMADQAPLIIQTDEGSQSIFPLGLVYISGELSLIAESASDHGLICVMVSEIDKISEDDSKWDTVQNEVQIKDFISSLKAIAENEIRLVLKIYSMDHFNASLRHEFFGSPYMIVNPDGDYIWAASIEPSDSILEWLYELGQDVEILDPLSFKKEYLKYCESRLKKIA